MNVENEYIDGRKFHSQANRVYAGECKWAVNKTSDLMARVLYNPTHENINETGIKRGRGKNHATWIFSEENGTKENIFSTKFELLIDSRLEPNASIGLHMHTDTEEIYYILDGSISMTTVDASGNECSQTLNAGDAHMVKTGQGHYGVAGSEGVRFVAIAVRK
jgi:mannose-6-phosphate isomerase-like protein (cupin superfamily)